MADKEARPVNRRVKFTIAVEQSEAGSYGYSTLITREYTIPWTVDPAKVARLIEREFAYAHDAVDDFHGALPPEPIELKATV